MHYAWRLRITYRADASSGRPQLETHTMKIRWKSMPSPGKERQRKIWQGQEGWQERKRKPLRQRLRGNDNRALALGECRNCGKHGQKAADCWYKQPPKPQGKGKGTGKSKSKVTQISESDSRKQVKETWTPNTSTLQPICLK